MPPRKTRTTAQTLSDTVSPSALVQPGFEELLSDRDLERITGRSQTSWQQDRVYGTGPKFIKIGRLVRYRRSDFEAWLEARTRTSTSDTGDDCPPPLVAQPSS